MELKTSIVRFHIGLDGIMYLTLQSLYKGTQLDYVDNGERFWKLS